ncbi:hypothetical protein KO02_17455 [Sphingobacterium sp. ML3W]|uniref:hypothetical protein n=1 Tax=Sphingobacterium sp. ML3W TaxID=1538644 RepID=UPI0004F76028|nr:hypothetical protein [Sphingobacterium sp. ML3W]AIM38271.1 hypothetical protein KO02_17455 [Sphingobacterium sp. ML3W]
MGKYQYGCKKATYGTMDPATGAMLTPKELEIYKDTISHDDGESTATKHYQQGNNNAKVIRYSVADETITFQILKVDAEEKLAWLGGTVTDVEGLKTWHKPKKKLPTNKFLHFDLEDGSAIITPNMSCMAQLKNDINDEAVVTITVVATVQDTGIENVEAFSWPDAPED